MSDEIRSERPHRKAGTVDLVTAAILIALSFLLAAVLIVAGFFSQFNYDQCGSDAVACDYSAGTRALWVLSVSVVTTWLASVAFTVFRRARRLSSWWVSFVGILVMIAVWVVFEVVMRTAIA